MDELRRQEGRRHAQNGGIDRVIEMLVDIFFETEVANLDPLGAFRTDIEDAAGIIVDVAVGEDVAREMHRIAPGEGDLLFAAGVGKQKVQPVVRLPAAGDAGMDDRLADQDVGENVGAQCAGEEFAAMAADRAARLDGHRKILAADRNAAVGKVLPDLVGDVEMGAQAEALGRCRQGERGRGRQQMPFPHESLPSRNDRQRKSAMGGSESISPGRPPPCRARAARLAWRAPGPRPRRFG